MGSATAWRLSARGQRVLLLDQFRPPHRLGSTHGESRVIREAYFEHPAYVPLVQRAYELWRELELTADRALLRITGGLMIGPPEGAVVGGARASAELHQLPHELLDADEIQKRFPALRVPAGLQAVFEPRAGLLMVEDCVAAFLKGASENGAGLQFDEAVTGWRAQSRGVEVETARSGYTADRLVIGTGAWLARLVPELAAQLQVERQVLHWFRAAGDAAQCQPEQLPVHLVEYEPGRYFYTVPDVGTGVKTALHHEGETVSVDNVRREVSREEQHQMATLAGRFLPRLSPAPHASVTCLYTNTPDGHFILDQHPAHPNVFVASPCSGHGFKFASAIGEFVADWATGRATPFDLSLFRLNRFGCR